MKEEDPRSRLRTAKQIREESEEDDFDFEAEYPPEEGSPETPVRIREYSDWARSGRCMVCGEEKEPYVEVEVGGQWEFTCQACYEQETAPKEPAEPAGGVACPSCGAPLHPGDQFCGKCGAATEAACPECGAEMEPGDKFCGKCGASL